MLPRTRDALELHTALANFEAKIWLHADQEHSSLPPSTLLLHGRWRQTA